MRLELTEKALRGQRWHGTARIRESHQELASQIIELGISVDFSIRDSSGSQIGSDLFLITMDPPLGAVSMTKGLIKHTS